MKKNVISFCVVLGLMYVFSVVLLGIGSVIIWKTGVTAWRSFLYTYLAALEEDFFWVKKREAANCYGDA